VSSGSDKGKKTCSSFVVALCRSFGTRNVNSTSDEPAGSDEGWTVTWADAGPAVATIVTRPARAPKEAVASPDIGAPRRKSHLTGNVV